VPAGWDESAWVGECFGRRRFCSLSFRRGLGRGLLFVLQYNPAMPAKNIITNQPVTKAKLERAKELRREMTPAEKLLWQEIRANKLGVRFRRQQIIQGFIVDFYCHKAALVVEVDGDIHDLQQEEDARREKVLREMGLRIVRFRNDEVLRELSMVVGKIKACL
jgi:very-short-patch-repair endonuclease